MSKNLYKPIPSADLPTNPPQAGQTRFWTPNQPDVPVSWKTRLKFDRRVIDAEMLINFINIDLWTSAVQLV